MTDKNNTTKILVVGNGMNGKRIFELIKNLPEDVKVEVPDSLNERLEKLNSKDFFEIIKK